MIFRKPDSICCKKINDEIKKQMATMATSKHTWFECEKTIRVNNYSICCNNKDATWRTNLNMLVSNI